MKKITLLIVAILVLGIANAQNAFQQLTFGGGLGIAKAYAGAEVQKSNIAGFGQAAYYPVPDFNTNFEGQFGILSGTTEPGGKNLKAFSNNYRAAIFNAELHLGVFFDYSGNGFLYAIKGFYAGICYGWLAGNVTNTSLGGPESIDRVQSSVNVVPLKLGYEYDILNQYQEPFLKICASYSVSRVIGRGLDGYYTAYVFTNAANYYNYVSIGVKYVILFRGTFGRGYNKLE